ncbi:hypothetical protein ACTL6U_05725 [Rhodovibrionaceae bacterium A322]
MRSFTLDLSTYDHLVFTTPLLFWDLSFTYLFKRKFGVLTQPSAELFKEAELTQAISRAAFLDIHKDRFIHSYNFLQAARKAAPELKIFIAPAVLPTCKQRHYPIVWRKLHLLEKAAVYEEHERMFDSISMEQPPETLEEELFSKSRFMADDQHHYNTDFVQLLYDRYKF